MENKILTDEQIKKALECCADRETDCRECCFWKESDCVVAKSKSAIDLINRLQAENERLENHIADIGKKGDERIAEVSKTIKAEAYKEFADRLKERTSNKFWDGNKMHELKVPFVGVDDLDNLLKELVGEE